MTTKIFDIRKVMSKSISKKTLKGRIVGYARVSTVGQSIDSQLEQLRAAECKIVYREKRSAAGIQDRTQLRKLIKGLEPGDVVVVSRIDRLARSVFDLLAICTEIADAGAAFKSIAEPWSDTATSSGRIMLAVLSGLVDVERDLIKARTSEGRERARAEGRHLGRPEKLTAAQKDEVIKKRENGATLKDLSKFYSVAVSTIGKVTRPQ